MVDASILITEDGADLAIEADDLARDDGLRSAILVSLFTDARVPEDTEIPGGLGSDRRGWWADLDRRRGIGSLVWLGERAKITAETMETIRAAASAALDWLVADAIAETVNVAVSRYGTSSTIVLEIEISRGSASRHGRRWAAVENYDLTLEGLRVALLFR